MSVPDELYYTAEHEWISITDSTARVGITDYAQRALGDVVYVSEPQPGARVTAGDPCGEVESTKSVSDIYSRAGWLFKITLDSPGEVPPGLLSAAEYLALTQEEQ